MAKMKWDQTGDRTYETGVDHGAVYPRQSTGEYSVGYPWNGLTGVTESPSGAEFTALYADNIKYLSLQSAEEFGGTIEAYTYPPEFNECDGTVEAADGVFIGQQARTMFGFVYRSIIGNDVEGEKHGYRLHLIWGCLVTPSEKGYATKNDSPEAITFSWEFTTTPVDIDGYSACSSMTIDSTKADPDKLAKLEAILFGSEESEPRLPTPSEVIDLMKADAEEPGE